MTTIDSALLERLQAKLNVGKARVYALIDRKVRAMHLPRHLAAIALAAERGINISRFASEDQLAQIRQAAVSSVPAPVVAAVPSGGKAIRKKVKAAKKRVTRRRGNTVFVVHGRDTKAKEALFAFLRAVGLKPLEWTQALRLTRKGTPYVGEVLEAAFAEAAAVVVLLTPDDDAQLRSQFRKGSDPAYEKQLTGQARPNVLFEAGMAFGRDPNCTILVQIGDVKPFSDVGGRHVVYLSDHVTSRNELVTKLANAGCNVDTSGTDWLTAGSFVAQPPN